ncbi:hypothetical protein ABTZ03_35645 [Kitasatospora sp. NPDC096077]|uniref:hypothetical protein n=1 Tax=Kitasatospora sp. NPDC096077 TaxID=3155544 RepID=UPI0033210409
MPVPHPTTVTAGARIVVVATRVVLVAELLVSLWSAVMLWTLRDLSYLDDDGTDLFRLRVAVQPALAVLWAGFCGWAAVVSFRRRSGTPGPAHLFTAAAVAHLLGSAWTAAQGAWPFATGLLALAALLLAAGRAFRLAR